MSKTYGERRYTGAQLLERKTDGKAPRFPLIWDRQDQEAFTLWCNEAGVGKSVLPQPEDVLTLAWRMDMTEDEPEIVHELIRRLVGKIGNMAKPVDRIYDNPYTGTPTSLAQVTAGLWTQQREDAATSTKADKQSTLKPLSGTSNTAKAQPINIKPARTYREDTVPASSTSFASSAPSQSTSWGITKNAIEDTNNDKKTVNASTKKKTSKQPAKGSVKQTIDNIAADTMKDFTKQTTKNFAKDTTNLKTKKATVGNSKGLREQLSAARESLHAMEKDEELNNTAIEQLSARLRRMSTG